MIRDSCTWKIGRTKTFRLGSSKILGVYGGNIQNIEKSMRAVYLSDGWCEKDKPKILYYQETGDLSVFTKEELSRIKIMIQTDEDGADARIVAYECEANKYRQLFIHGIKVHVYLGIMLFPDIWAPEMREAGMLNDDSFNIADYINAPIQALKSLPHWKNLVRIIKDSDDWVASKRYYYFAKQTGHSGNYDIQAQTFRMNILEKSGGKIMIPMEESRRFLETYRSVFPEIPERNQRVQRQGRELGVLYNLFGHPYYITSYKGCWTENTYKEWYSWSPQSTVGMIINIAVGRWQEFAEKEKLNWDLLANRHDSMITQVPLGEVLLGAAKSQEYVEKEEFESPVDGAKFFMKSETKIGFCWAPYDKVKCPLGLKEIKV